jgi:hypothetical protein
VLVEGMKTDYLIALRTVPRGFAPRAVFLSESARFTVPRDGAGRSSCRSGSARFTVLISLVAIEFSSFFAQTINKLGKNVSEAVPTTHIFWLSNVFSVPPADIGMLNGGMIVFFGIAAIRV